MAAQPYASAAQSAPARYSATPQQASAGTAQSAPASYSAIPQQASANAGSSSGAANAGNGNSGVLSGTSYQSSGATSPLTPYNTVSVLSQQKSFGPPPKHPIQWQCAAFLLRIRPLEPSTLRIVGPFMHCHLESCSIKPVALKPAKFV